MVVPKFAALSWIVAAVALTACGGGSSAPAPAPGGTAITLTVVGGAPSAAAMQIGGGAWTNLAMSGSSGTFNLPAGATTYGAAIVCNGFTEYIVLLTVSDTRSPSIACPAPGTSVAAVAYDVSAIPGAQKANVYIGSAASFQNTATGTANFTTAPAGTQDVAVVGFGAAGTDADAVKIQRGVSVPGRSERSSRRRPMRPRPRRSR